MSVFFKDKGVCGVEFYFLFNTFFPNIGNLQSDFPVIGMNVLQAEPAVHVGCQSLPGFFYDNSGANHGFSGFIEDLSGNESFL